MTTDSPSNEPHNTDRAPTLTEVAAKGNRSFRRSCPSARPDGYRENNAIVCEDGARLSVIAGAGAYSIPRPDLCLPSQPCGSRSFYGTSCQYDGPYSHVEVMLMEGCGEPSEWDEWESGGVYSAVPVESVRALIESHGGERTRPGGAHESGERT